MPLEPYRNRALPIERRLDDLLGRMTLEDKLRQLVFKQAAAFLEDGRFSESAAEAFFQGVGIGALQDYRIDLKTCIEAANAVQKHLIEHTRLGIPALIACEGIHGWRSPGATIFPQSIGLASAWDDTLVHEIATAIAREARAAGVHQALAPDLDLGRDPRWGRTEETYGEDPYLVERLGVAYVKGLQGEGPCVDGEHLVATLKHYAAHGSPEAGINLAPVAVGKRELHSTYLPPFQAAVREARALSVMPCYSECDGVPASASYELLTKILREEWGFSGYTFADYGGIRMLHSFHRTAADPAEAGRQALMAGLDLEAHAPDCFLHLGRLVEEGKVPMARVDEAARRILRVKFLAGIFENPYVNVDRAIEIVNTPAHKKLALRAAQESIVLLKNEGGLLPLSDGIRKIAVLGPNSAVARYGDYTARKEDGVSPLEGIRNHAGEDVEIVHAVGCSVTGLSREGFGEAVDAARSADAAILVLGGTSETYEGVGWCEEEGGIATCGEGFDRTELDLPGVQQQLAEAIIATGTPTVLVLVNGRPYSIEWLADHVPAIVEMWYAGEQGGNALAGILFGKVNPSGKLPITFPRSVGHVPAFYNHKPSARGYYHKPGSPENPGRDYVFSEPAPLFSFGHGLSYTTFAYSKLCVSPEQSGPLSPLSIKVDVANTGGRAGKEVVQLYVNDQYSSVTTPVRALRRFAKVHLEPGESRTVEFVLGPEDLALYDRHMDRVVEAGAFEVLVGGLSAEFEITDSARLEDC